MAIANNKITTRIRKAFRILLFPRRFRERQCEECGRPYLEHAERTPTTRFNKGNVSLFLYRDKTGIRETFWLRVGVWKVVNDDFYFGQLFAKNDFSDLQFVVSDAVELVNRCDEVNWKNVDEKMSSRRQ